MELLVDIAGLTVGFLLDPVTVIASLIVVWLLRRNRYSVRIAVGTIVATTTSFALATRPETKIFLEARILAALIWSLCWVVVIDVLREPRQRH